MKGLPKGRDWQLMRDQTMKLIGNVSSNMGYERLAKRQRLAVDEGSDHETDWECVQ